MAWLGSSAGRKKLVLLAFGVLAGGAIVETGLRLVGFPSQGLHTVDESEYRSVPGMLAPGQNFLSLKVRDLPHRIRVNQLGLRGPETTRKPERPRVLFVGDSFTFGDFVDDEDTLPAAVERVLVGDVEVLNGGVNGTTIVDQRIFLQRFLALSPDVVVLIFFENDLNDMDADPPLYVRLERNRSMKSGILRPLFRLVRDTALFNAALDARRKSANLLSQGGRDLGGPARYTEAWMNDHADLYREEFIRFRDAVRSAGAQLVVAGFPHPFSLGENQFDAAIPDRIGPVSRALEADGIDLVDLRPALARSGYSLEELFLLPHDGHASPLGNRVAAEALAPYVDRAVELANVRR